MLFAVGSTVAFDSEHPKFTSIYYRVAAERRGRRGRASTTRTSTRRPFLGEYPRRDALTAYFPQLGPTHDRRPAPAYGLRAASLTCSPTSPSATVAPCEVRVRAARDAAMLSLLVHTIVGN